MPKAAGPVEGARFPVRKKRLSNRVELSEGLTVQDRSSSAPADVRGPSLRGGLSAFKGSGCCRLLRSAGRIDQRMDSVTGCPWPPQVEKPLVFLSFADPRSALVSTCGRQKTYRIGNLAPGRLR